ASLDVSATEAAAIQALSFGFAGSGALGGLSIPKSAGTSRSSNTVTNLVEASIKGGSTVTSLSTINAHAEDDTTVKAHTGAVGLTFTGGLLATGGAVGGSVARNDVADTVRALMDS